jgi:hypothetical protein
VNTDPAQVGAGNGPCLHGVARPDHGDFWFGQRKTLPELSAVALSAAREVSKYRLTGLVRPADHDPIGLCQSGSLQPQVGSAAAARELVSGGFIEF